ncbi:methyltransferase [Laceyella putida]|uniref:Methyltransferase n=1 Tax=Laceyella putida TaxID=110101 RepID=A0ABW2RFY3_9BACL
MDIRKKQRVNQFNRASLTYDEHAEIFRKLAYRLLLQMDRRGWRPRRILDIGCGTGYMTQLILDEFPDAGIVALDIADKMVQIAYEKVGGQSRVKLVVADVEAMDVSRLGKFDLIVCNAVCHWFQRPKETFAKLADALKVGGRLLVSTYGPDTCGELASMFRQVEEEWKLRKERHMLPFRSVKEWEGLLDVGLTGVHSLESWMRNEYPDCRSFLYSIKAVGEAYSEANHPLLIQRRLLQEVIRRYDQAYRSGEGVYATVHFLQLHLKKTDDSAKVMLFK